MEIHSNHSNFKENLLQQQQLEAAIGEIRFTADDWVFGKALSQLFQWLWIESVTPGKSVCRLSCVCGCLFQLIKTRVSNSDVMTIISHKAFSKQTPVCGLDCTSGSGGGVEMAYQSISVGAFPELLFSSNVSYFVSYMPVFISVSSSSPSPGCRWHRRFPAQVERTVSMT